MIVKELVYGAGKLLFAGASSRSLELGMHRAYGCLLMRCILFDSTNITSKTMNKGGAAHSGGSCQAAFSYDKGETWAVVHSWEVGHQILTR